MNETLVAAPNEGLRGNARYEVLTGSELDPIDPAGATCARWGFRLHDDRQAGFVFTTYKVVDAYFSLAFVSPKVITDRPKTLWRKLGWATAPPVLS